MKIESLLKSIAMAASICGGGLLAGEPLWWERVPNRPAPAQFDTFHGETLDFRCTFVGFGVLPFGGAAEAPRLYYQTNGMGAAWWSVPATVESNTVSATFPPLADPGAERMAVFFGAPSNAYAAAQVRFRNSPGVTPNVLEPPSVLDWQAELTAAINALGIAANNYTDGAISLLKDDLVVGVVVPNRAENANHAGGASAIVDNAEGIDLSAAQIKEKLDSIPGPGMTTNDVNALIGGFAATGTVSNAGRADTAVHADDAGYTEHAWGLTDGESEETRTAATIFAQLDGATETNAAQQAAIDGVRGSMLTTNDVCNIVTNEVEVLSEWRARGIPAGHDWYMRWLSEEEIWNIVIDGVEYSNDIASAYDSTNQVYDVFTEDMDTVVAYRVYVTKNALGMARLIDIPTNNEELANGAAYIALEPDVGGERTALTVGSRTSTNRGTNSVAFGQSNSALGTASFAQGSHNSASGGFSIAMGRNATSGSRAFTWNQGTSTYSSHGTGTFNINPQNGIYGMYIGDSSLYDILLAAIGNRSTNTVTFIDENGDLENEEVYPPLGVAKSEDLIPIQNSVNAMWATMYGENVWIAITNYMRQVPGTVPSLRLWEVRDSNTNLVYSSAEEIEHITTQKMNAAKAELEGKMTRKAWGSYQSSGEDNPSSNSVTVVNSEKIMLTGGGEWYRAIETGGAAVWVLKSRGLLTLGGDTNGYFRVCDAEGNAQIEVVKTADQTVDAIPSATDFDENDDFAVTFNASGSTHPKVSCATDLANDFEEEDDNQNINSLGISVSWDKNENDLWVATIHQDTLHTRLFLYGKMKVPGENLVRNNAPTSLDGGIYINNVKYRLVPYSTGGKTYLTLEVW